MYTRLLPDYEWQIKSIMYLLSLYTPIQRFIEISLTDFLAKFGIVNVTYRNLNDFGFIPPNA